MQESRIRGSRQSKREVECPCPSGVDDSGCQFHDPVATAYIPDHQIRLRYHTRRDVDSPTLPATAQEDSVNHHVLSQPLQYSLLHLEPPVLYFLSSRWVSDGCSYSRTILKGDNRTLDTP